MTMSRVVWGVTLMSVLILRVPQTATACAVDNVASLHADTVPAMLTTSLPHGPGPWAPFTIAQAIASKAPVQFTEAQADLARTLPAAMRRAPYRWAFGDGTVALGHDVTHRYAHPGRYIVSVFGYDRGARGWFTFDQALVHVVPPDQVLRANLGYQILQGVTALSGVTWPIDGALILAVLVLLVHRARVARLSAAGRRG